MLPTPKYGKLDGRVYEPAEDSFLLLDSLEERAAELRIRKYPTVFEIGAGSGIVSVFLKMHILPNGVYLASDINPTSCRTIYATAASNISCAKRGSLDVLQMSLASGLRKRSVDILVFNPPYVPAESVPVVPVTQDDDAWLDLALLGGKDGMVLTWQLLDELDDILADGGVAYILFCARNKPENVAETMRDRGWTVYTVLHRKAGWEVLSVLEFKRS